MKQNGSSNNGPEGNNATNATSTQLLKRGLRRPGEYRGWHGLSLLHEDGEPMNTDAGGTARSKGIGLCGQSVPPHSPAFGWVNDLVVVVPAYMPLWRSLPFSRQFCALSGFSEIWGFSQKERWDERHQDSCK